MREAPSARELIALAAIVALGVAWVWPRLALPVSFDALQMYLPMARRLLAEGPAYLQRPESLAYAPVAFVFPALFGAHEMAVRWANVALYGASIAAAFFAVRSAHSPRAAFIAAALVAISPTLHPYMADVLTEPPFVFFTAVWIASVAALASGGRAGWALVGGIALALATLTRPALMFFPLIGAAFFAWRAGRVHDEERRTALRLALLHLIGLAGVAAWIARNAIEFGFPSVAVGAGNALFLGINPLVDGFDPIYYGLSFDDGAVTMGLGHLSIEGDRLLRRVALRELADIPFPVLLEMGVRKALAFVFVTDWEPHVARLRAWRVVLVFFAIAALFFERRSRLVQALALFAAYMVAVHLPLLYHHRYSVGAIDLPLALLAAIGLAVALDSPRRLALLAFVTVIGIGLVLASIVNAGPGSPHPERSPYDVVWSRADRSVRTVAPNGAIEIPITHAPGFNPSSHFMIEMDLGIAPSERGARCPAMHVRYKGLDEPGYAEGRVARIPLRADGRVRTLDIGMAHPIFMDREGTLRLELECGSEAQVTIANLRVLAPNRAVVYRNRVAKGT